jgi:hypothetical protein
MPRRRRLFEKGLFERFLRVAAFHGGGCFFLCSGHDGDKVCFSSRSIRPRGTRVRFRFHQGRVQSWCSDGARINGELEFSAWS